MLEKRRPLQDGGSVDVSGRNHISGYTGPQKRQTKYFDIL